MIRVLMLVIFAMSALNACVKVKDKDEGRPSPPSQQTKVESKPETKPDVKPEVKVEPKVEKKAAIKELLLSVRLTPLAKMYRYRAEIFVEYAERPLLILKTDLGTKQSTILTYLPGDKLVNTLEAGQEYSLQVMYPEEPKRSIDRISIQVPRDTVIDSPMVLDNRLKDVLQKTGRLFLTKNAVLTTNGQDLLLRLDELVSDGGLIRTFPPDAKATINIRGRSGGQIAIYSKRAQGNLSFELRGEDGGHGSAGQRGYSGANGIDGKGIARSEKIEGSIIGRTICAVGKQPTPGAVGGKGFTGLSGQAGGHSGRLILQITEEDELQFHVERISGRGGFGGKGGPGGIGGRGGGIPDPRVCQDQRASNGNTGSIGDDGKDGMNGEIELMCVKRAWEKSGSCS